MGDERTPIRLISIDYKYYKERSLSSLCNQNRIYILSRINRNMYSFLRLCEITIRITMGNERCIFFDSKNPEAVFEPWYFFFFFQPNLFNRTTPPLKHFK